MFTKYSVILQIVFILFLFKTVNCHLVTVELEIKEDYQNSRQFNYLLNYEYKSFKSSLLYKLKGSKNNKIKKIKGMKVRNINYFKFKNIKFCLNFIERKKNVYKSLLYDFAEIFIEIPINTNLKLIIPKIKNQVNKRKNIGDGLVYASNELLCVQSKEN